MDILYEGMSKIGGRKKNEDYILCVKAKDGMAFFLADGLGGHDCGEEASKLAVESAAEYFLKFSATDLELQVAEMIQYAQDRLMEARESKQRDMKTTLTVLAIRQQVAVWGYVGDSRLYYFQKSRIQKRTYDHSVPQMLVDTGQIKEKEIRKHPDRNRLLRVLGTEWKTPRYTISKAVEIKVKDSFLLCSDGFWEPISEKQMISSLKKSKTPEEWIRRMEKKVLQMEDTEEQDNYSAIAVWVR